MAYMEQPTAQTSARPSMTDSEGGSKSSGARNVAVDIDAA